MKRSNMLITITLVVVASMACTLSGDSDRAMSEKFALMEELGRNLDKWEKKGASDYDFRYRRLCYCPNTEPVIVSVRRDEIESIRFAESGEPVDLEQYYFYDTIPGIFRNVHREILESDELTVSYDPHYGFPTRLSVDQYKNAIDDEYSITAGSVEFDL